MLIEFCSAIVFQCEFDFFQQFQPIPREAIEEFLKCCDDSFYWFSRGFWSLVWLDFTKRVQEEVRQKYVVLSEVINNIISPLVNIENFEM